MATKDNPIQDQELQDEAESEAVESNSLTEDESEPVDEIAEELAAIEEANGTNMVMPAEIAAINIDNQTAEEATEGK